MFDRVAGFAHPGGRRAPGNTAAGTVNYGTAMTLAERLNATVRGLPEGQAIVFVHGYGCGQEIWRHVAPEFEVDHRVLLIDLPGSGGSEGSAYDPVRHASLSGYRDDLIALLDELDLDSTVLVGHSVSAMIVALVQIERPDLVDRLILASPSPRYIDDGPYVGGFSEADINDLLTLMSRNHLGWQDPLAGMVAAPDAPGIKEELVELFCRMRPAVAAQFAEVTFRGDNRADLVEVTAPTLVLQCRDDLVAPLTTGKYVSEAVADSELRIIETRGHCPQLSAPEETTAAIRDFLARTSRTSRASVAR